MKRSGCWHSTFYEIGAAGTNSYLFSYFTEADQFRITLKKTCFIAVLLLMYLCPPLSGAGTILPEYDTLKLIEGSTLILPGSKIKFDRDTTVVLQSGLNYQIRYPRGEASNIFFDSLETRAERSKWTHELHDIIITSPRRPDYSDTLRTRISADAFVAHGGKYIRSIRFVKLEPFGPSIFDTARQANTNLERFGNDLHRVTHDRVLQNHLLFKVGDLLDPNELADNERILRELPFIQDAVIRVLDAEPGSDSADLMIVTKDNFSIGLGGELYDYNSGRLSLFEKNLFGIGHELHMVFYWDADRSPWLGNEIYYIINNMGGSFINSKIRFAQTFDSETYELELQRRFFTPDIKWAGALNLERTRTVRYISYADTAEEFLTVKYNIYDGWGGRSFYMNSHRSHTRNRINFVVASRILRNQYIDRPAVTENSFYEFHNRILWLNSFSVSSQSFFKSNLILDFGRTEDVPQGMLFSLTIGPEISEFNRRLYTGVSISQGRYLGNFGYLHTLIEGGGFLKNNAFIEQGVINMEANYFTPLFVVNRFKFRHFISTRYVRGIRRFPDEYIGITDWESLRGFRSNLPVGQQKLIFNYEADAFTPYYLYGFRFVWFGFTDFGMVGPDYKKWHDGAFYSGFGVGVRIRNERLVFETISIRIGYYPNHPERSFPLFLDVYGEQRLNPANYYVTKPQIIGFK
jgi:hypothetical protein